MNKKTFYLLITLGVLLTIFSVKFYKTNKTKAMQEYKNFIRFEKKIKEIAYLKNSLSDIDKLKTLKFCKIENSSQKLILTCKNINKRKMTKIQNVLFRGNYQISKFNIEGFSLKAEILKGDLY